MKGEEKEKKREEGRMKRKKESRVEAKGNRERKEGRRKRRKKEKNKQKNGKGKKKGRAMEGTDHDARPRWNRIAGIPFLEKPCPNGHTLCSKCKNRVNNRCPSCRHEINNIRCLALEKIAQSLDFPCSYQSQGCHEIFPYHDRLRHEHQCKFRPYNCPYAGSECSVTGDISTLMVHLTNDHKVDLHVGCTFNHRYVKSNPLEVQNATWMLTVFSCFDKHFCLHFEAFQLGNEPVYMAFLQFMGEEDEAKDFSYDLEVGGNRRKLTWQGIPRSIRDSHRRVRDSHDGLLIPRNLAPFFSGGDQQELKLRVMGRIWKET